MTHMTDDELASLALDEAPDDLRRVAEEHLAACAECTAAMEEIRATLNAAATLEVPERGEDYGAQVWAAIESRLPARERDTIAPAPVPARPAAIATNWRPWLAAAAALLIASGSYWLGRRSVAPAPSTGVGAVATNAGTPAAGIRERVVLTALGDHFDRTERTLVELLNSDPGAQVDISAEQAWARDLLDANRIYRQAAKGAQAPALSQVLEDLEPVLMEIANSPSRLTSEEFEALRARIDERSLVFKVRVTGAGVRARAQALIRGESKL